MPMGGDDMAKTKYKIILSDNDIEMLNSILADDEPSDRIKLRARILLLSDENNKDKLSVPEVAKCLGTTHTTVQTVRQTYGMNGVEAAVSRKKRVETKEHRVVHRTDYSKSPSKLTPEVVAKIFEIASSDPPEGMNRWTQKAIAEEGIRQGLFDSIAQSTIARLLKNKEV